jgi:hypothetical protein
LTTKIVALVDALGNLVRFVLLPGQRHDAIGVAPLIEDIEFAALLAASGRKLLRQDQRIPGQRDTTRQTQAMPLT